MSNPRNAPNAAKSCRLNTMDCRCARNAITPCVKTRSKKTLPARAIGRNRNSLGFESSLYEIFEWLEDE